MRGALGGPRVLLRRLREVMAEPVSAQDRHTQERMVNFFAGFHPVRERRVSLCVRKVDRIGLAGHQTDKTFVGFQDGLVDGFALKTFGSV